MDRTSEQWTFTEGTDVVSADGQKIGTVSAVHQNHVVVEKGVFFPTDHYIPASAIANYDGDKIYLNVTKDAALGQGWEAAPTDDASYSTTVTDTQRSASTRVEGDDVLRVPVHEEELSATTRGREIGAVRVTKDVVSEEQVLEVPVTEERVHIQRRAVDREVGADKSVFEEGTIDVPIRGEEVNLHTRVRVAEEIELSKEAVQRTEQVGGTVRREEVRVDETGVDTTGTVRSTEGGTRSR